jgi:hypothetical protein
MINESKLLWDSEVSKDACRFCKHCIPEDGRKDVEAYREGTKSRCNKFNRSTTQARTWDCLGEKFKKAKYRRFAKEFFPAIPRDVLDAIVPKPPKRVTWGEVFKYVIWRQPEVAAIVASVALLSRVITYFVY